MPDGLEYQGRVSENGGVVQVFPEIRAENGPICGFRIVNTDWGKIPFEVKLISIRTRAKNKNWRETQNHAELLRC